MPPWDLWLLPARGYEKSLRSTSWRLSVDWTDFNLLKRAKLHEKHICIFYCHWISKNSSSFTQRGRNCCYSSRLGVHDRSLLIMTVHVLCTSGAPWRVRNSGFPRPVITKIAPRHTPGRREWSLASQTTRCLGPTTHVVTLIWVEATNLVCIFTATFALCSSYIQRTS